VIDVQPILAERKVVSSIHKSTSLVENEELKLLLMSKTDFHTKAPNL
jgi:hypothetical protein